MRITHVETYAVRIPLVPARHMITALGKHTKSAFVLVRIGTDTGIDGVGEAAATPSWSGETVWGTQAIIDHVFAPVVIGCDPHNVEEIDRRLDRAARHNWFAKAAIEMACWDLQGKAAGQPVYELLGGAVRPLAVRCRFSMGAYEPDQAAARARELVAEGFDTIKVKVGTGDPRADVTRVRAVRAAIGPERALTIDANCGWDVETAIRCLHELEDCRIALDEQPTPDGDYEAIARVRRETTPPVMADDMCFDLVHARELVRCAGCDVISVYPGKNGGIRKARQIAEFAARHGIACSIGSNLEWDVGTAAMAHLVVATPNLRVEKYPGDMLGPVYHEVRVVKNPLDIRGPIVTITDRPGLGIEIDWEVVKACLQLTSPSAEPYPAHGPPADAGRGAEWQLDPDLIPNVDDLVMETEEPVDIVVEKQRRLLTEPLYSSWVGPGEERHFLALANVGLFYAAAQPPLVPDVMLSLDVRAGDPARRENLSYIGWVIGKMPEAVIEIVSDRRAGEETHKLQAYAQQRILYYVIYDPKEWLKQGVLRVFELRQGQYAPIATEWLPAAGLGLTLWPGTYEGMEGTWLRWCDREGKVLPTGRERADQAEQRADQERQRVERLVAQLRAQGIEPSPPEEGG